MGAFIQAVAANPFLLSALIAGLLASIVSGIVGSYVVVKRIAFISGGIAHSVLSGIGICLYLDRAQGLHWLSPLYGAIVASVVSALLIGWIHLHYREREDTVIAAIWSVGMALGVIFISQTPGFNVELTNFLVGNILWVTNTDLYILLTLDLFVLIAVGFLHKRFLAICFDEEHARLQGLAVNTLYLLMLVLIALTIVLLVQVVGIILVMTMLTIPAAIASAFTNRLSMMMALAVFISALFSMSGLAFAYHLDWPAGASIALVAGLVYTALLPLTYRR